jgi:hypothetical protein
MTELQHRLKAAREEMAADETIWRPAFNWLAILAIAAAWLVIFGAAYVIYLFSGVFTL